MNSEDNYPPDLAMVPTGTKCDTNMVSGAADVGINISKNNLPSRFSPVSGVLQPTVSRRQQHQSVRFERLLQQMQQPWGRKRHFQHLMQLQQSSVTECDL